MIVVLLALLPLFAPPRLPEAGAADVVVVIDRAVAIGSDDAEERVGKGRVTLNSSDLELTTDGTNAQTVGLRFTNIAVPPGAAITAAWVQFRVDEVSTGEASLTIAGQVAEYPPTFASVNGNISSRPRTTATVGWVPPPWPTVNAAGLDQRTPDLSAVIGQIIGRPGWVSGNALVLVITGTGRRTAEAFEGTGAPILHLEYSTGPATNQPPSVAAGPDQSIALPAAATLDGTVSDDELPSATLSTTWSMQSGPGTVSFGNPGAVDTTASFSQAGTYVLRLSADDSELTGFDELTVTVTDTVLPVDEIHHTFTGPTSVTFDWRGGAGDFRYGLTDQYGTDLAAQSPNPPPISSAGPFWEASLTGLQPGTTYHYSIDGGPDHTFTTAPTGDCRFDAEGDIGSSLSYSPMAPTQAQIAADAPDFVLALGDLTYGDSRGAQVVDQHFNDVMAWSLTAAYMPAWGNHDWRDVGDSLSDDLSNYVGRFAIPNGQGSIGTTTPAGEDWGWFDACGVRFISYPEPYSSETWMQWQSQAAAVMAAAQADPSIHFIVTFGHRPAYSTGHHAGSSTLASILGAFGETYSKYVLNLNGHSHDYERFQPINNVVHITSGGGGASLETPWVSTDPRTAFRAMHLQHLRVDVTADRLRIEAICGPATSSDDITCTLGSVIDSVTITADRNGSPTVSAGPDQSIVLPGVATLEGAASDDGLPSSATLSTTWSAQSGPGTVIFGNPSGVDTTASFSAPGTYVLRLSGDDSVLSAWDELTVTAGAWTGPVDEVHYTFSGPSSVALDWRGGAGDLRYGLTEAYGTEVIAQTPSPLPFSSAGPFWEASLAGLQPGTTYHYSIGGGPDSTFTTAPSGDCRFDVEGDIGSSLNQPAVAPTQAQIAVDGPDFVLAVGDLTYGSDTTQQTVDQHFNDVMAWSLTAAYMPAWGNHEWESSADDLRNYMGRFSLPNGQQSSATPTPAGEDWGWFDACGVRFISYPEPYTSSTWTGWQAQTGPIMAAAQADPSIHFIVTFGHRPAYSTGKHPGELALAAVLDGFGQTYPKYVLNLNGHSHDYERFRPISGVTHITTGGGGKSVSSWSGTDPRTAFRALHFHHLRVGVTATAILVESVCGPTATADDDITCAPGSVIDTVTISADGNSPPTVSAGPDQTIVLPAAASLEAMVTDDGLPALSTLTTAWSVVSGPGGATFGDANAVDTTASFLVPGTYVLRLTATDSELSSSDEVTVTAVAEGGPVTIQVPVAASSDDAEENLSGGVSLTSSDLELVTDGTTVQIVGTRFAGVGIPAGSTIVSAYVQFQVDEVSTAAVTLTVAGQAADNAATFAGTSRDVSSRPRTTASVTWSVSTWPSVGAAGPDQRTPDLATVIQEIVGRPGWSSGNALAIIVTGSGRRTAEAFGATGAPVLHVTYVRP